MQVKVGDFDNPPECMDTPQIYCSHTDIVATDSLIENPRNPNRHHPLKFRPGVLRAREGPVDVLPDNLIAHPGRVVVPVVELPFDALLRLPVGGVAGVDNGFDHGRLT